MKTIDLQQEYIDDSFQDCVEMASKIFGVECCDTVMQGDREKGDSDGIKYQILPDSYSAKTRELKVDFLAFESYYYDNFGKWKGRCYFDTPYEAFFNLIKAWEIWTKYLEQEIKQSYIEKTNRLTELK
jgi:hypothetical protein